MGYIQRKKTLVIQAEGKRSSTKKQKRTSMKEDEKIFNHHGAQNFVCWMEMKIFVDDQPTSKRMRQECAADDSYRLSSNNEDK